MVSGSMLLPTKYTNHEHICKQRHRKLKNNNYYYVNYIYILISGLCIYNKPIQYT